MKQLICITCPVGCKLEAALVNEELSVAGHACKRGIDFAMAELTAPMRTLCSTVRIAIAEQSEVIFMLPVRTDREIPKAAIIDVMKLLASIEVTQPVSCGDTIASLVPVCEGNMIATCDFPFD